MANEQNLRPSEHKFTLEEAKKGAQKSAEARRRKRDLREALEILLEKEFTDKNGVSKSGTEIITAKLFEQAAKGNVKAFETIRSTVGQDPVQKVMVAEVDNDVISEIENMVLEQK
jgi:hypothetical protein